MRAALTVMAAIGILLPAAAAGQTTPLTADLRSAAATPQTAGGTHLSLADAVTRGLQYNLEIILEEQQRRLASGTRLEALSALIPHVNGSVRQSVQITSLAAFGFSGFGGFPTLLGPFTVFDARLAVSAPLFDAVALADLREKRANEHAVESDYRGVRETVILAVGNLYLEAIADGSRVEAARSQVSTAEALVRLTTDQNAAGIVARIDVLRQQVQLENARVTLIARENELAKRKLQLARAIGMDASQPFDLADRITFEAGPGMSVDEAVMLATTHRPDLRAAEARLEAARAANSSARANRLPSLRVDGDVGAIGQTLQSVERTYSLAATVHIPIFDGRRTDARAISTDAVVRQREAELADLTRGLRFDVSAALLDVGAAAAAVEVARSGETLAQEELTQAEDRFRAGVASSIELTQGQEAVARASEQYIASVYSHAIAKAMLARAIGEVEPRFLALVGGHP